ncbi:hypothetical protein MMPV_004804 [Pyropia vietnamensis]
MAPSMRLAAAAIAAAVAGAVASVAAAPPCDMRFGGSLHTFASCAPMGTAGMRMYWSMGANNVLSTMFTYPASKTATGWAAVSLVDADYTFGLPPKVAVVGALKYDGSGAEAAVVALRGRGTGHRISRLESELDGMMVKVYFQRQMPTPVVMSTYVPMVWTAGMLPVTVPTLKARPWPGMGQFQPAAMGPQMMAPYEPRGFPGGMVPAPQPVVAPAPGFLPAPVMAPVDGAPMATPNPDCLIDYNGGPMQFRSCRTLPGDIGMRLLWQTNPANDTLILLFTAVTPGWAAFSFSGADQLMLGNPNKLAVIGVTTEDGATTARVYSIAARTPAGVQPAEDAAIMGAYDNVSAERDGELIKVYFERPLSAVPDIGGPMTNAIWSIGEVAPSLTNLPGHTLAEAGIVNLFGVRMTPTPVPAPAPAPAPAPVPGFLPAPVMAPVDGAPMATPNPDCLIDYNGGPMQFRSCRTLPGDIGMRLLWQTNPANDTLILLFTAVTPGWAAFSFSGADQLMLGNPNKLAVIGVTTEDGATTARVYSIAARTPAGVQPAEDAAIMGAYDNVSAERDGELIKVYFERPLSAVPDIGGPMTNAIWSIGEVAPSLTNLPGHTLAEAGIVNLFGVRMTPTPVPAPAPVPAPVMAPVDGAPMATPNPDCLIDYNGGPMQFRSCRTLPGDIGMRLLWQTNPANDTLILLFTAVTPGWAAFSFSGADQLMLGNPNKLAVIGVTTEDGATTARVYSIAARTPAGVQPAEDAAIMGAYDNVSAERDGELIKVYFERPLSAVPDIGGPMTNAIWSIGEVAPSLTNLPGHTLAEAGIVNLFGVRMTPTPVPAPAPVPAPVMAPVDGAPMATPNPDCLIDYNGGPMQFRSCRTLPGDIGMRLLWQTNPANDTLILLFTAVTPGWAAFSFSGADQLMLGNPNKLAVIGVTTEDGATTARVYSIAARTPAGVQPAEDAAIMGAYDNVSAERDGELIKVYFERPLSAVPDIGGPMTNAIWSIGEVAPSLTNLPGHTLAEAGIVNLFGVRVTPTPTPTADDDAIGEAASGVADAVAACFPADATATLASGARVRMDELAIGDTVAIGGGRFSDVFAFTHADAAAVSTFMELTVAPAADTCAADGQALRLTPGHYLSVNGRLAAAGTVVVGDFVLRSDGSAGVVTAVTSRSGLGLYNPQTLDGAILVDGVITSTYTTAVEPRLAAAALVPLRAAYALGGRWLGSLLTGSSRLAGILPAGPAIL